jgi:hypothetical protein
MCFNYKSSLFTFFIGFVFSILLIHYGNKTYGLENKISGIFLIFISFIQFMDFLFWIDIKNKIGINHITTILGPILNVCQPTILYLIKYYYYKPDISSFKNFGLPIALLNFLYFIYFVKNYAKFLLNDKLITSNENGHLKWPWIPYFYPYFYLILFAINIFYLFDFKYALVLFTITYFFLLISNIYFNYNVSEMWCYFGAFIPLIMFFTSFYI